MDNRDNADRETIYDFGPKPGAQTDLTGSRGTSKTSNSNVASTRTISKARNASHPDQLQSALVSKPQDPFQAYVNSGIRVMHGSAAWLVSRNPSDHRLYVIKTIHSDQQHPYLKSVGKVVSLAPAAFPDFVEAFHWHAEIYVVFEHIEITAAQVAMSRMHAEEKQVACMAYQALEGLSSIHSLGFVHGSITLHHILITGRGSVKLAFPDLWLTVSSSDVKQDTKDLGLVVTSLMEWRTGAEEIGNRRLQTPETWGIDVREFAEALRHESLGALLHHSFLRDRCHPNDLELLVGVASVTTARAYNDSLGIA